MDGKSIDRLTSHVSQYVERGTLPTEDFTYPPVIRPGQTLDLEATFHFQAQRLSEIHPSWPRSSLTGDQYVAPHSVKGHLTVVDQLKREGEAGEVDFRGAWYVEEGRPRSAEDVRFHFWFESLKVHTAVCQPTT